MAHTHRDTLNYRRKERWKNWRPQIGSFDFDYGDPLNRYPRLRGGNMVMAPSVSGIWSDERFRGGADRDRQRRERQNWKKSLDI